MVTGFVRGLLVVVVMPLSCELAFKSMFTFNVLIWNKKRQGGKINLASSEMKNCSNVGKIICTYSFKEN